jgi:hypothetical protein
MKKYGLIAAVVGVIVVVALVFLRGCDQTVTKRWGGTTTITLDKGQRLEMITWKDDQVWVQTRPRTPDESPVQHEFREHSKYGMLEGKVVIKEK